MPTQSCLVGQPHKEYVGNFRVEKPFGYECCYCWQMEQQHNMDLHEILMSRKDVMGSGHTGVMAIMDRRNCGWIHRGCHVYAEGGPGRIKAINHLIRYEGFVNVMDFITEMTDLLQQPMFSYAADVRSVMETLANDGK